jgi:hypothetical protein
MIYDKDMKNLPCHSIYVMHLKLVGLTSIDRYLLRKREVERSETGIKPLVRGSRGRSFVRLNVFLIISSSF